MICPKCNGLQDKVIDSRKVPHENIIRRRRKCLNCSHNFTTHEMIVETKPRERGGKKRRITCLEEVNKFLENSKAKENRDKVREVAKKLGVSKNTIYRYMSMNSDEKV